MKILGCIPARYASTRFPGKPLALIAGVPMIVRVCDGARKSRNLTDLVVATDDARIFDVVEKAGYRAVMTDPACETGTDRIYDAAKKLGNSADIVVNIQGDEPLVAGEMVDALVEPLLREPSLEMSTLAHVAEWEELGSPNTVKVIADERGDAIYFSRFAIPYSREAPAEAPLACLRHIGLYGYRRGFLERFCRTAPAAIEKAEALEQLRALHLGAKIRVVKVSQRSWGVDTPDDLAKIEVLLKQAPPGKPE